MIEPTREWEGKLLERLKAVRQGDVVDAGKIVYLLSPDTPSHPDDLEGVPHEEPVMTADGRIESRRCVILSQDCDLRRSPSIEPYIALAPIVSVDNAGYREAEDGMSVRHFAYPAGEASGEIENPVVDVRLVMSIEKTALGSSHVALYPCPLSEPKRSQFRVWVGRRYGRVAFPDEIVRQVVEPIAKAVKRVRENEHYAGFFHAVVFTGMEWTPGRSYCSLLLLTDPALCERHGVSDETKDSAIKRINKALNHFARDSDYSIIAAHKDVYDCPAAETLSHHELPLELDTIQL